MPAPEETLLFFDSELDLAPRPAPVVVQTQVPPVVERVRVRQEQPTAFLARDVAQWSPEDLRDYVAKQIHDRWGVFPRDPRKEHGIFHAFVNRWGIERAVAIARYAYEVRDGIWKGAPVKMQRFCLNSDPYFAQPIWDFLDQHT